jgi:hypothetical protein
MLYHRLYRARIAKYPVGALQPRALGEPDNCKVEWLPDPHWEPPNWPQAKYFTWPGRGKSYFCKSSAERLARQLEEYGATVVVEQSGRIMWPEDSDLPEQL